MAAVCCCCLFNNTKVRIILSLVSSLILILKLGLNGPRLKHSTSKIGPKWLQSKWPYQSCNCTTGIPVAVVKGICKPFMKCSEQIWCNMTQKQYYSTSGSVFVSIEHKNNIQCKNSKLKPFWNIQSKALL